MGLEPYDGLRCWMFETGSMMSGRSTSVGRRAGCKVVFTTLRDLARTGHAEADAVTS